jgi:hypothetical protein
LGVQSVTCVAVVAESAMYRGCDGLFAITSRLVDGCGLAMVLGGPFPAVRGLEDGCIVVMSC